MTGGETAVHDAAPMRFTRWFAVSCGLVALAGIVTAAQNPRDRHTDDHGSTQDDAGNRSTDLANPGAILEFSYTPAK